MRLLDTSYMARRQGGERGSRRPKPPSALTFSVVPVHRSRTPSPAQGTGAQPHCEVGPACWPGDLAHLLLWAKWNRREHQSLPPSLPLAAEQLACGSGGLCFCKPKGCSLGSQPCSMWLLRVWFRGQSVEWLLGVCLSLHQRD